MNRIFISQNQTKQFRPLTNVRLHRIALLWDGPVLVLDHPGDRLQPWDSRKKAVRDARVRGVLRLFLRGERIAFVHRFDDFRSQSHAAELRQHRRDFVLPRISQFHRGNDVTDVSARALGPAERRQDLPD